MPIGAARAGFRMGRHKDAFNLVWEVPQKAWDLWQAQPDGYQAYLDKYPHTDVTSYAGRSGDVATGIQSAWDNDEVADLGQNNEYQLQTTCGDSTGLCGVVGENCTIYVNENDLGYAFSIGVPTGVFVGFNLDISENSTDDVAPIEATITDEFWAEDVGLIGQRNRYQGGNTNNVRPRQSWLVNLTDPNAEGFAENIYMGDGEVLYSNQDFSEHSQGIATDPPHEGYIVYKDAVVNEWVDNGIYLSYDVTDGGTGWYPGHGTLWDCDAKNNRGGCFRLGYNDLAVGGTVEATNTRDGVQSQPLVFDYSANVDNPTGAIGVEVLGNDYNAEAIVVRNHDYVTDAAVRMDRVVVDTNHENRPVRISKGTADTLEVEIKDVYWRDRYQGQTNSLLNIWSGDVFNPDGDMRLLSEDADEVELDVSGNLEIDGTSISSGTHTADELGLESPLGDDGTLPNPYFDYSVRT